MRNCQWLRAGAFAVALSIVGGGAHGEAPVVGSVLEVNVFAFGTPPRGAKSPKYPTTTCSAKRRWKRSPAAP
jgi:hypothetical protein